MTTTAPIPSTSVPHASRLHRKRRSIGVCAALSVGLVASACGDDDDDPNDTSVDVVTSDVTATSMVTVESEVTLGTVVTSEVEVTKTVTEVSEVEITEPGVTTDD